MSYTNILVIIMSPYAVQSAPLSLYDLTWYHVTLLWHNLDHWDNLSSKMAGSRRSRTWNLPSCSNPVICKDQNNWKQSMRSKQPIIWCSIFCTEKTPSLTSIPVHRDVPSFLLTSYSIHDHIHGVKKLDITQHLCSLSPVQCAACRIFVVLVSPLCFAA